MTLVCMSFLWVGSQIPLYLFGSIITLLQKDIGGADRSAWFAIAYLIPLASVCPFVGALSDLFGRQKVAIVGQLTLIIGPIITATAHNMNVAIGKCVALVSWLKLINSSWPSLLRRWCWPQRADRTRWYWRNCSSQGSGQVCWWCDLDHPPLLPGCLVGPVYCPRQQLALQWSFDRLVEFRRSGALHLLLPRSVSSYRDLHRPPRSATGRLCWWFLERHWHYPLHDGSTVGSVAGQ